MDFLQNTFYHNTLRSWLAAGGAFLASLLLFRLLRWVTVKKLGKLAEKTATDYDDFLIALVRRIRWFFVLAIALEIAAQFLLLPAAPKLILDRITLFCILLQVGLWGNQLVRFLIGKLLHRGTDEESARTSTTVLGFIGNMLLWTLIFLFMLDNLGVNVTALVTGLGIGGVAIALALQNILGDLFASLSIMIDKPFVIGDFVRIDPYAGTVEHIGLKTTRLRSISGEQLIVSNADLLKSRIQNFKRMEERRVLFTIGIVYETPPELIAAIPGIIREIVAEREGVRFDRAHFREYGAYALLFEAVYFVLSPDYQAYMDHQESINLALYRAFRERGIRLAYPTQRLYVEPPGN